MFLISNIYLLIVLNINWRVKKKFNQLGWFCCEYKMVICIVIVRGWLYWNIDQIFLGSFPCVLLTFLSFLCIILNHCLIIFFFNSHFQYILYNHVHLVLILSSCGKCILDFFFFLVFLFNGISSFLGYLMLNSSLKEDSSSTI